MSLTFESASMMQEPETESGFRDAFRVLSRHKTVVLIGMLVGIVTAIALLVLLEPQYTASGIVAVIPRAPDPFQSPNAPVQDRLDERSVGTEVVAFESRDLARQVVESLGLDQNPALSWRQLVCKWTSNPVLLCPTDSGPPTMTARVDWFVRKLKVTPVQSTSDSSWAVSVGFSDKDPVLASKVVNALITTRQQQEIQEQAAGFDRTATWLDQRSEELRGRWLAAERAVTDFRQQHQLTQTLAGDKMAPLIAQQMASAATESAKADSELAGAQAKESALQDALAAGDQRALIQLQDEPILVNIAKSLDELELKRSFMGQTYRNQMLGALDHEIAVDQRKLAQESRMALNEIKNQVAIKSAEAQRLRQNLAQVKSQFVGAGAPLSQLETLEREAADASAVYSSFLTRAKQLADRSPILSATTRVLSTADTPDRPSFPQPGRFLAAGLVLGLVGGAGVAWGREKLGSGFQEISRVGLDFSVPLLSIIPALPSARRLGFPISRYVEQRPYSATAEAVRTLGTSIALANRAQGGSCAVAITSAVGQEGKSTLCYWLAEVSAREGQSVLLVDGDYRKVGAARGTEAGLTDLMAGRASLDSVIINNGAAPMHYLPAGRPRPGAFTGADLKALRALVAEMKRRYALVIIDAPPLMGMSEGLIYATVADQSIVLCRWQSTNRAAVTSCLRRLRTAGAHVTGIVLSMVNMSRISLYSEEHDRRSLRTLQRYYLD